MTIEDVIKALNSEDCMLATGMCLMRYKERDCWKCILKEYSKTVYNKAIDDFAEKLKSECREHYIDCGPYFGGIKDSILYEDDIDEIAEQLKAGGKDEY